MLNQDYKDMLSLLLENKVEFLLIGAYAMAVYGFPRSTADIDFYINPSADNAKRIIKVLQQFGAPLDNISISDFETPEMILQIGIQPRRIDLITKIDGLEFEEAYENKVIVMIENLSVPIISKQDLLKNKMATGREKDILDAENIKRL